MFTRKLHQIILCANAKQLVVGVWHADQLQHSERFLNTTEGHAAFKQFLESHADTKVLLISNAVEEDYRVESLPHTTGTAKKELISRKLDQFYRGINYRTAHFIMREKDKRKDDRYLFLALNNDDFLQDWMRIIEETESQLVGVYVLPMLSRFLVKEFNITAPHILLCEMLSSGLRQTYLHNGRLRMSRLIPNVPTDSKQLSYFYSVETQKTRLYLMSKRLIARDTVLNVQLASIQNNRFQSVQDSFQHEADFECEVMPLGSLIQSQQLSPTAVNKIPELLHMQLLASGIQVDNLAPEALTKAFRLRRVSTLIKTITLILAISAVLFSLWFLYQSLQLQNEIKNVQQATKLEQLKYKTVAADFPTTKLTAIDLKKAVEINESLVTLPKSPRTLMLVLSDALLQIPAVQLNSLYWQQSNLTELKSKYALERSNQTIVSNGQQLLTNGVLTADIQPFDGNYREANHLVNQLANSLQQDDRVVEVKVLQLPTNQQSYADLSGSTKDSQSNDLTSAAASFKLLIVLSPAPTVDAGAQP